MVQREVTARTNIVQFAQEGPEMPDLQWKTLTKRRQSSTKGIPPGKEDLAWVTNTVTLVYGESDAVLVDTFLSQEQSSELAQWLSDSGRNLSAVYITHAHADHFFGLGIVLDRFPQAKAIATAPVVEAITRQTKPDFIKTFWESRFPGQLPKEFATPNVLEGNTFSLEGKQLEVVPLGSTDTVNTTALHVPSIKLVMSGDAVYNNTHLYLAECDERARGEWLHALDIIDELHPVAVVTGHGVLDPDHSPRHIDETRRYIKAFNLVARNTSTRKELYEQMLSLYPNRVNPGALWAAASAVKAT